MVHDAPAIDAVLPMFLEFCRGAVLVAHNAGFDIGFLKSAAAQCDIAWPNPPVLSGPAGPAGAVPRGGAERAGGGHGPAVPCGVRTDPPRPR